MQVNCIYYVGYLPFLARAISPFFKSRHSVTNNPNNSYDIWGFSLAREKHCVCQAL